MSEAKFRVGDRVQTLVPCCKIPRGVAGTVVECIGSAGVAVAIDGHPEPSGGGGWVYTAFEVEPERPRVTLTPPPNTVPVRIAVAVGEDGKQYAAAECCESDAKGIEIAKEGIDYLPHRITFVTAHVPLPEQPAEVEGVVE